MLYMEITVIIPAYNERKTIEECVRRVEKQGIASEILIVDDGSTDGTREILQTMDGQGHVRVMMHPRNMGKGAAVRTGHGVGPLDHGFAPVAVRRRPLRGSD